MRILHVINSLDPSGAERHLANLWGPLEALGVENHLVTFFPGSGFQDQLRRHVRRAELAVGLRDALGVTARMAREVDVVHTQLTYADVLGRAAAALARTPSVTTLQASVWSDESRSLVAPRDRWRFDALRVADAATARLARRFFAVSSKTGRSYIEGLGVPDSRVQVIANSVDLREFDPARGPSREEARRAMGFEPDELAVVTLSRLHPQKGLGDAIRAVAKVAKARRLRFQIAGLGAEREKLQSLIDETGAPASLLGRRDAVTAYRAADLFLLTSYYEGMPLALIEAMAMGLPCLCSSIPENVETAGDAVDWAPVGDVDAFARGILALADDPARREDLSRRARERAKVYSADVVAARFLDGVKLALG